MPPDSEAQALGHLLAHAMMQALDALDAYGACCPRCCGACAALHWYRDNDPARADGALQSNWDGTPRDLWDFQNSDGTVKWSVLEQVWQQADKRGCHAAATVTPSPAVL